MVKTPEQNVYVLDEEACWQAIQRRDGRWDGVFYFGVKSTGIYCKPSCRARHPRRSQVHFFSSRDEAERAGFRPCQRCKPEVYDSTDPRLELARCASQWIQDRAGERFTLQEVGSAVGVSPAHLLRTFKAVMGVTPRQYADQLRLERLKQQLREGVEITPAMYQAGYSSSSRLYENARRQLGMTPGTYRRRGEGMDITYTIVDCPLGRMMVAATQDGICAVSFAEDDAYLVNCLVEEYPAATIVESNAELGGWVEALLAYLQGSQTELPLPIDVQATAFQRRVWEALRRIPYGETRTYTEVAGEIGQSKAVRAVANACAANPTSLINPCHRVLRRDRSLGGYRWGVQRKQALLELEKRGK